MAARALQQLDFAIIRPFTAGGTVRRGYPVKDSAGTIVECTAIADNALGVSVYIEDGGAAAASTDTVGVALLGTNAIAKCLVGTAAVSAIGDFVCVANATTDGIRTATIGGGNNKLVCLGQALQSGAAADLVGVNLACGGPSVGS